MLVSWESSLPPALHDRVLGIPIWQIAATLALLVVAAIVRKLVLWSFGSYLRGAFAKLRVDWIDGAVRRCRAPVALAITAGLIAVLPIVLGGSERTTAFAIHASHVLLSLAMLWLAIRLVDVLCDGLARQAERTATRLDDQLVPMLRRVLRATVIVFGVVLLLQSLGVNVGSLIAGLGIGGIAIALAAKDTIANLFGSFLIFSGKPFQIGDLIKIGTDIEGTVEEVGFRTTRVRTAATSVLTIPNAKIADAVVDNLGARQFRRFRLIVPIAHGATGAAIERLLSRSRTLLQELPVLRPDSALVEATNVTLDAVEVLVECQFVVPDYATEQRTRTQLVLGLLQAASDAGLTVGGATRRS